MPDWLIGLSVIWLLDYIGNLLGSLRKERRREASLNGLSMYVRIDSVTTDEAVAAAARRILEQQVRQRGGVPLAAPPTDLALIPPSWKGNCDLVLAVSLEQYSEEEGYRRKGKRKEMPYRSDFTYLMVNASLNGKTHGSFGIYGEFSKQIRLFPRSRDEKLEKTAERMLDAVTQELPELRKLVPPASNLPVAH